ncbi:MAG: NADH-quinone oxidoreductase subunit L [Chloroflexi bacterium]|nr:NADH-quinone oxidoreductase subunit L [Chloroflexota bacterium]
MDVNWLNANYLPWLIPVPPLISFMLIILFTGRNKFLSHSIAVGSVVLSFLLAFGEFLKTTGTKEFGPNAFGDSIKWMDVGLGEFRMGVLVDPLTAVMLFMVPIAMLMIFVYSMGYMGAYPDDDPHKIRYSRFFAYLSLFAGGMLTLVVADNLLLLFMGWEIMGLCSYLLIGFLFEKKSAQQAAVKAFMTTRVADVLMLVGIGYLYAEAGTLSFRDILYNETMLERLGNSDLTGYLGLSAASIIGILLVIGTIGKSAQFPLHAWLPDAMEGPTPVSAMIHAAAMVSAGVYAVIRMFPLLEAGGNPHTGDYTAPLILMGVIGSVTALGAAILGVGQNDIKRVLAYSTISQLGFMVAALGIGAYVAAAFHLITHAFFKALLFMSSGSVIHAMEHGEHALEHGHGEHGHDEHHADEHAHAHDEHGHGHSSYTWDDLNHAIAHGIEAGHLQPGEVTPYGADYVGPNGELPDDAEWKPSVPQGLKPDFVARPNNIMLMGGLINKIPVTAYAMLAGAFSLAGFPLITAGFWSKDEIIADAMTFLTNSGQFEGHSPWLHILVFFSLIIAATFTAFYTMRMWFLTFLGKPRSAIAEHATLMNHVDPEELSKAQTPLKKFWLQYSNSALMQGPLVILAFFAITAGFVGIHEDFTILHYLTGSHNFFHEFVGPSLLHEPEKVPFKIWPVLMSLLAFGLGAGAAYLVYGVPKDSYEKDPVQKTVGDPVWQALKNRFGFDTFYLTVLYQPFELFARKGSYQAIDKDTIDGILETIAVIFNNLGEGIKRFNHVIIDGVGDGIPQLIGLGGRWFRNIQSGRVQQYLLFTAVMLLAIGLFFVLRVL